MLGFLCCQCALYTDLLCTATSLNLYTCFKVIRHESQIITQAPEKKNEERPRYYFKNMFPYLYMKLVKFRIEASCSLHDQFCFSLYCFSMPDRHTRMGIINVNIRKRKFSWCLVAWTVTLGRLPQSRPSLT